MRLPPIPPEELSADQKAFYADMKAGVAAKSDAFKTTREDGALLGPWNACCTSPRSAWHFGQPRKR
jgi:4-carboxymuconolactone decarboxylase